MDATKHPNNRGLKTANFHVLRETVVSHGENRTIYRRVLPPVVDPISTSPQVAPVSTVSVSEADLPESVTGTQVLALSAMVYPDGVTRIDWRHEGMAYTAWSNIDFRYLRPVGHLTTPDQHFLVVLSIEEASPQHPAQPTLPSFTPGRAEYLILTDTPETALDPEAFTGLDALHAHYESNETSLKTQHQRNKALNAARQRHAESNPPTPQERVIHFWRKMQNGDK